MNRSIKMRGIVLGVLLAHCGICFGSGLSDHQKSLELRANAGDVVAMRELGEDLEHGLNGLEDPVLAAKWYRLAADYGDRHAQSWLGFCYFRGRGVPKDAVLAYMWTNIAAASGDESDRRHRDSMERMLTAEQVTEAQRMAREWKPKTALKSETKSERDQARTVGAMTILNGTPPAETKTSKPESKAQTSFKINSVGPRFDFGELSATALPAVVIFSGIALGLLGRKRRDTARVASGKPPLVYEHQVGALAAIFYLAGIAALVTLPKTGSCMIALALGALFHFLRIGSLRKQAEKESESA